MNINIEQGKKIKKDVPLEITNARAQELKRKKYGIRVIRFGKRRRFVQTLDSYKKVLTFSLKPTVMALPYVQQIANAIPKVGYLSPFSLGIVHNVIFGLADGITLLRNSITLNPNIKAKFKMQTFRETFDNEHNYSWNKQTMSIKALNDEKHKIVEQISGLKVLKLRKQFLEQTPEIVNEIKYINNILDLKKKELSNINKYISILSLEKLNKKRVNSKLSNIVFSGIGFISRSIVTGATCLCGSNPISYLSTVIFVNSILSHYNDAKNSISDMLNFRQKREKANNLAYVISEIPSNEINQDIITKSKLLSSPLTEKDINTLFRLKVKFSSSSYLDLPDDIKNILHNVGKDCLNLDQVNKLSDFLKNIEGHKESLSYEDFTLVENLRNGIDTFNTLYKNYDDDTIQLNVNLYNTKLALKEAYHASKDVLSNHKNWIYKAIYEKQYYSNETAFNLKVYDYFMEHANISVDLKNKLIENSDMSKQSILKKFSNLNSELSKKAQNEHIANYIIDLVKSLPPRKKIIKNGVNVSVERLNLNNVNDRILVNDVYENWKQYEHAKSFIKAALTGRSTKSANKLINTIQGIKDDESRKKVYDSILEELSSIDA